MRWMSSVYGLLLETVREFYRDNGSMLSAGITYYALFSIAPLVLVSVSVASLLIQSPETQARLQTELEKLLGSDMGQAIAQLPAQSGASRLTGWAATVVGAAIVLYAAIRLFFQVQHALNAMWGVRLRPDAGIRGNLRARAPVVAIVLLLGVTLAVMTIASVAVSVLAGMLGRFISPDLINLLGLADPAIAIVAGWLVFMLVFSVLPDVKVGVRQAWLGALLTSAAWALATELFALYLSLGGGSAYQAAGAIVVLLVFVHYLAYIFLLGAKLTCVLVRRRGGPPELQPWAMSIETPVPVGAEEDAGS